MKPIPALPFLLSALALIAGSSSADAQVYPRARTGGNYMYNFYFPPAGSSTPWWPSWSPDGQWIAFGMDGSIWRVRVGESTAHEMAYSDQYLSSPEWSPDGEWLVYTADDDGRSINLVLMNVRTGETTALTVGDHVNVDPAWSPDGQRIAYVSTSPNGYFNIHVMQIRDGRKGEVTAITTDNPFGSSRLYFVSLVTPSTRPAISSPNCAAISALVRCTRQPESRSQHSA